MKDTDRIGGGTLEFDSDELSASLRVLKDALSERDYRLVVGSLAKAAKQGGQSRMFELTGTSRDVIRAGTAEATALAEGELSAAQFKERIRKPGAGRKPIDTVHPDLRDAVEQIVRDKTYGDPTQVLLWTTLSLRKIADILAEKFNIAVGKDVVARVLKELGYSRQQNQKQLQVGTPHPDRNAQFEFINGLVTEYLDSGDAVLSIDCKKKELLGNFKTSGSEYRLKKNPRLSLDHDFELKELGHIAPYGVYDINENLAFINLGTSCDTAEFAVNSILLWWERFGKPTYPNAKRLLITCDGGGSNSSRARLWKTQLAALAEKTGLQIQVAHFPPGCSKWNKIEHRVFSYITKNCAAQPFVSVETALDMIGSTNTRTGLVVKCNHDANIYKRGIKITDEEFENVAITRIDPMPQWNYIITGFKDSSARVAAKD